MKMVIIMESKFQEKLRKQIMTYTLILVLLSFTVFSSALFYYTQKANSDRLQQGLQHLNHLLDENYQKYQDHLISIQHNENYIQYIQKGIGSESVFQTFYNFNKDCDIKSNLVLSDIQHNVIFTTFDAIMFSSGLQSYNSIIIDHINEETPIASGVYTISSGYGMLILTTALVQGNEVIGYASYYIDGKDFNYAITSTQFDGAILDRFGTILAISNKRFVSDPLNRLLPEYKQGSFQLLEQRYLAKEMKYSKQDFTIVSIIVDETNLRLLLLSSFVILIMGTGLIILSRYFARKISLQNSTSIDLLLKEISCIRDGDLDHEIVLKTNDEFEQMAYDINAMLTQIKMLNKRNAELNYVSKLSELKQLEAQFNPHFLYNTLETIRYSILMGNNIAGDLIIKLTSILRYSINNTVEQVRLQEDMEYLQIFLNIQKYRFDERFTFHISIDDACLTQIIPKLFLQPLLENSIRSGFHHKSTLHISIYGKIEGDNMQLTVEDDGIGMNPEEVKKLNRALLERKNESNHHGLYNTARRLYLFYGEGSNLSIRSTYKEGTSITATIFLKEEDHV